MRLTRGIVPVLFAGAVYALLPPALSGQDAQDSESRDALIARAQVWIPTDIPSMDLRAGPSGPGAFPPGATVTCEYEDTRLGGASPKFACRISEDDDELKVKYAYGRNGEVYGEVIASRLLWALGFGADHMYPVRVICRGCPNDIGFVRDAVDGRIVDPASIERKMPGRVLLDDWHWGELDRVDEEAGGASLAERDALKLLAVLLQHSDSKPDQQRLICVDDVVDDQGRCVTPVMMVHDVGITFGRGNALSQQPRGSVNLAEWSELPIWKGTEGCVGNLTASVRGTLRDPVISEEGRQFLADLLTQLSDRQLRDMFEVARVSLRPRNPADSRSGYPTADEWVAAFAQKRTQIVERRCDS
jgi:hypothetical protein